MLLEEYLWFWLCSVLIWGCINVIYNKSVSSFDHMIYIYVYSSLCSDAIWDVDINGHSMIVDVDHMGVEQI